MIDRRLSLGEAVVAALTTVFAALVAVSYVWARFAPLSPFALLGFAVASGAVLSVALLRRAARDLTALFGVVAVAVAIVAGLLRLGAPTLLPPGGGSDLVHHLQLVDYLERHWRLPDASLEPVLGEMTHYTPGLHLVAALAGAWSRTSGLHAIYPVIVFAVALKLALVFLIAWRLVPPGGARLPLAAMAVVVAWLPQAYVLDSFVRDSFLAQVFAELFAVAMWWALVMWDARPSPLPMLLFAAAGIATFLSWPMWIGPPIVAAVAALVVRSDVAWRERLRYLAIALGPIAVFAAVHFAGRAGWVRMAAATGAVVQPSAAAFGWLFLALALVGLVLSLVRRQARTTLLLVLAIAVQALSLYAVARSAGASTPYMAFKMAYLIVYPLAALSACGLAVLLTRRLATAIAWVALIVIVAAGREQYQSLRLGPPIVSHDLYVAGQWARANVEAACFEYLVPNADTAYWLHLAVLGNPRMTPRTGDDQTFDPGRNVLRWIQPGGLPYAIVDLRTASRDVLQDAEQLEAFGTAAVVRRTGPASCPEAQRFADATR